MMLAKTVDKSYIAKSRPIILNAQEISAFLDGVKSNIIRPIKKVNPLTKYFTDYTLGYGYWLQEGQCCELGSMKCPYGNVGDSLWVRETWGIYEVLWTDYGWEDQGLIDFNTPEAKAIVGVGRFSMHKLAFASHGYSLCREGGEAGWKSPTHMPKWASRITLEIITVEPKKLHSISKYDAEQCGAHHWAGSPEWGEHDDGGICPKYFAERCLEEFPKYWNSMYGDGFYESNPWVWVIKVQKI